MQTNTKEVIHNSKIADSSSKIIFEDNTLYAQFLRDYIEFPCFKNIQPEDIEDVSEQYIPLFAEERNADRVKRINIKSDVPFFLVSLIEHKSSVDYNVSMQILRYMIHIWEVYAKEAEKLQKGITKTAGFRYPPILPIVYYEGIKNWTVPLDFCSRIIEGESFKRYVPNFEYYLVPLRKYSNEELLAKKDEISLVMLINRMQNAKDIEAFRELSAESVDEILKETPEYLLDIISDILRAFLLKMNLPLEEAEDLVGKVKEKKMGYLFENMEKMDIQEERRRTAQARKELEEAQRKVEKAQREAEEAQKETQENAIRLFVEGFQEAGLTREVTFQKLKEKFELTEAEASEKMNLYWKNDF